MKTKTPDPTPEEIAAAKSILARVTGKKGGKNSWEKLTQEQREKRVQTMLSARWAHHSKDHAIDNNTMV